MLSNAAPDLRRDLADFRHVQRPAHRVLVAFFALLLAGCASYVPSPLDRNRLDASLANPSPDWLAQHAARLRHPRIAPVVLDFTQPFTPEELAVIAVLANPDLKAARAKSGVAAAQVFNAGLLPDPQINAGLDFPVGGPGSTTAYNLGLSWDFLELLLRPSAVHGAEADREQVRYDIAWQEWTMAEQVKILAERITSLDAQQKLADEATVVARDLLQKSRRAFERRDIKIDDLGLRETAYLDAQDRALSLQGELSKARLELDKDLGLAPGTAVPIARAARARPTAPHDAAGLFEQARNERLDLLALHAGYSAQEYKLQHELLAQYPKVNLGLHLARDTSDVRTVGFGLSVSLPILNANRGAVAVARATREQLYAEYVARLFQTRADIAALVADLQRIGDELGPLDRELPTLALAAERMSRGVATGNVTIVAYEAVRASLLDKQLKQLALEQSAAEQVIALELATGIRPEEMQ